MDEEREEDTINDFTKDINMAITAFKKTPRDDTKKNIFQKLFELMRFECGRLWGVVLSRSRREYKENTGSETLTHSIDRIVDELNRMFYIKSKWIKVADSKDFDEKADPVKELARIVGESTTIEAIPSKLFLEFLLFIAGKIYDIKNSSEPLKESIKEELICLGKLARESDQEQIFNCAQEVNRFFLVTTEPTAREIYDQIVEIYHKCKVKFTGNISISHIIGQLCEGITDSNVENTESESSQSSQSSQSSDEPLKVRTNMEQLMINNYYKLTNGAVETSHPLVKTQLQKPISSIRRPLQPSASRRITTTTNKQPRALPVTPCKYGATCYKIKDPQHILEYSHPTHTHDKKPTSGIHKPPQTPAYSSHITTKQPRALQVTPCKYGATCRDIDPRHRRKYSHPTPKRPWVPGGGGKSKRRHTRSSKRRRHTRRRR